MTAIDPTRLAAIFRSLTTKSPVKGGAKSLTENKGAESTKATKIEKSNLRDKDELKRKLRGALLKLKSANEGDYHEKAPQIVIKEILLWEFGEEFLNYSDFNQVSQRVTQQVLDHPKIQKYFYSLIDSLVLDGSAP